MKNFLVIITVPITLLNWLGWLIAAIWLAVLGEWGNLFLGVLIGVSGSFVISIALMPGMLFSVPAAVAWERGNKISATVLGSLNALYLSALITLWCVGIMWLFARSANAGSIVPLLIWSYGSALAPWMWLAQKDLRNGGSAGGSISTLSAQAAYILCMIFCFFGSGIIIITLLFGLIILCSEFIQLLCLIYNFSNKPPAVLSRHFETSALPPLPPDYRRPPPLPPDIKLLTVADEDRRNPLFNGLTDAQILSFKEGQREIDEAYVEDDELVEENLKSTGVKSGYYCIRIPQSTAVSVGHNIISHQTRYTIELGNLSERRADCTVWIDGELVGCWRVNAGTFITIERPVDNLGKFTFYVLNSEEGRLAGLSPDNPKLGLVEVCFVPEIPLTMQPLFSKRKNPNTATGGTGYSGISTQHFTSADLIQRDYDCSVILTIKLWDANQPRPKLTPINPDFEYA